MFCFFGHHVRIYYLSLRKFTNHERILRAQWPFTSVIQYCDSLYQNENLVRKNSSGVPPKQKTGRLRVMQNMIKNESVMRSLTEARIRIRRRMENVERENIWTIPNILCVMRIAMSPYIGVFVLEAEFNKALLLMVVASATDMLDGYIARTFPKQSSKLGSFLDPLADKVLIATLCLTLTYAGLMPILLASLILLRDIILASAGVYIRYKSLPPPRTLLKYFDASYATAQLAPTALSKFNTTVQLTAVAATLTSPVFGFMDHPYLHYIWYFTAATTVVSAISYVWARNTYKILRDRRRSRSKPQ